MSLKQRLAADLKLAMKEKDIIRKNTVQMVRSAVLQYEKDNRTELDDDGVIDIIAKSSSSGATRCRTTKKAAGSTWSTG